MDESAAPTYRLSQHSLDVIFKLEAETFGAALGPRLDLIFLPLMRHSRPPLQVATGALELARRLPEAEQRQVLASLIGLGQRFLAAGEIERLLEGLMATSIGQQLVERGLERGIQQGLQQGLQQGRMASKREDILKVLGKRHGAVPAEIGARLQQIEDVARLDALFDAALSVESLDGFTLALGQ